MRMEYTSKTARIGKIAHRMHRDGGLRRHLKAVLAFQMLPQARVTVHHLQN